MQTVVFKMLFFVSVTAQFGKHVYVQRNYTWPDAQKYCRDHYTDLSPITTRRDEKRLKELSGKVGTFWIGLYRDGTQWMWSGGGLATYKRWDDDEPDDTENQIYGCVCWEGCGWNGWHNYPNWRLGTFFCFNLIVVELKMTWDEAIWHCKTENTSLTSLASETEHLLAVSEIQEDHVTERVWIGLRYLGDRWLWVDGDPLVYEAWSQGDQDHQCPLWRRCGALTKGGLWESRDCEEKLHFICY